MLQAPSHFSRVCGHGHIKKFWLMQTQKENQACESKSSLTFSSPTPRSANRGSVKGIDNSPWSSCSPLPHNSAFGDAAGTSPKRATFTCAESLSPSPHACKASSTPPPSSCSGSEIEKERLNGRYDCLDSFTITSGDTHSSTPLPCPNLFISAVEQISPDSTVPLADVGFLEPTVHTIGSSKEHSSSFTENSPDSHSSQFSRGIQHGLRAHRPLEACSNHAVKLEDRSSPANTSRDLKFIPSYVRFTTSTSADVAVDKGRSTGLAGSRIQEADHERASQAAYMQHSVLKACSLCGTTKTPMWRSGPQGPKSLCNACGIRFKKYRSFPGQESSEPMASPLLGSGIPKSFSRPLKRKQSSLSPSCEPPRAQKMCLKSIVPDVASGQQQKKNRWHQLVAERQHSELKDFNHDRSSPWFTRAGPPSLKKIYGCSPFQSKFKKLVPMEDHLSVGGVFAEDEKEAAVLLMHLSCGLVY